MSLFNVQIGWQAIIDRYDLKYINEKRLKVIEAKIFKFNRTTKAVTFEVELFSPIDPDLMVNLSFCYSLSMNYLRTKKS